MNKNQTIFPKSRSELPDNYKKIYEKVYKENRDGTGLANFLSQKMEEWGHTMIENNFKNEEDHKTLEVGAGNLNHLKYVKNDFQYDIIEPSKFFYENSSNLKRVNKIYSDISEINHENKYDRIISVMVLEHVLDLPSLLNNSKKILKEGGCFQASIPCQGELSFYLGWRFTTGLAFYLKHGLNWGKIMEYEHVNSLSEIYNEMKKVFKTVKIKRSFLPFFFKKKHLSFYAYLECSN